jgi:lysophospholipase L1-like esterase
MPWYFTDTASLAHNRANKQKVLADIAAIMPVIEDGFSGAMDGIENFADSGLHLSDSGTAARSRALADALKAHLETR